MLNSSDSLEGLTIFVQVIDSGSFTAAANELGHAVSHISKSISRLEERLGARLINRTTRSLSLTDVGQVFYDKVSLIVSDARDAERSVRQLQDSPTGRLKISLPTSFGQSHMQPIIREYMLLYPEVKVQIDFTSRLVDVIGEGFDLCVRMGQLKSSNLIGRTLLDFDFLTVATPDYLAKHPEINEPYDLKNHQVIKYMYNQVPITWEFTDKDKNLIRVDVPSHAECNNLPLQKTLVMAGLGVAQLPSFICEKEVAEGRLVNLLPDYNMNPQSAYLVYPHRVHLSAKVRAFVDLAVDYFKQKKHLI